MNTERWVPRIILNETGCSIANMSNWPISNRAIWRYNINQANFTIPVISMFGWNVWQLRCPMGFYISVLELFFISVSAFLIQNTSWLQWHKGHIHSFQQYMTDRYMPTVTRHIDGLVQDCSISSPLAMEILKSCTKPSIYCCHSFIYFICHCHPECIQHIPVCDAIHQMPIRSSTDGSRPSG